jgi:hypothetical protein
LKFWRRWLIGLGAVAILAPLAHPAWEFLAFIIEDRRLDRELSNHGAVGFSFLNDRPEEVRIVALRLAESSRFTEDKSGGGYTVARPSRRDPPPGAAPRIVISAATMSTLAGRQPAEIRYRIGDEEEVRVFRFEVDLVAQHRCRLMVRFGESGPSASVCTYYHSGSHGGTQLH